MTRNEKITAILDALSVQGNVEKLIVGIVTENINSASDERLDAMLAILEIPNP